mmetsp:Transcript_19560/g.35848  ORF Transcript_19560/g.35848 Transcript_19560/m.35848 type:complete len:220 (-) Transcript_19560:3948-4607(-)
MLPLFLAIAQATYCPEWTCDTLGLDTCVKVHGSQLLMNTDGCDTDFYCKLSDVNEWYALVKLPSSDEFPCTRQNFDGIDSVEVDSGEWYCGDRNELFDLYEGSHLKRCSSRADCLSRGGWTAECMCGMDGFYYCKPDISSEAFDEYWDVCESVKNKTFDPQISGAYRTYWEYYAQYYIEANTAPECARSSLWEFKVLDLLEEAAYGGSAVLVLGFISTM